jgi:hypothetical protein
VEITEVAHNYFICGLLDDAISSVDYITPNNRMTIDDELEMVREEVDVA